MSFTHSHRLGGFLVGLALTAVLPHSAFAQGCTDPVTADFQAVKVIDSTTMYGGTETGNYGVVQMSVAPDGKIFVAKMCSGEIRIHTPSTPTNTTTALAGTVPTHCNNEDGLLGVVVSNNYATTKWIYVFHTDANWPTAPADADTGRAHVLTRYTYDSSAAAGSQLKNPKIILRFGRMIDSRPYHAAGGIDITADGTMVIGTGDDTSPHSGECDNNNFAPILYTNRGCDAQKSASNTASLRGKMLRIKPIAFADNLTPTPGIGSTYDIPSGNLWELIDKPAFNPNWVSSVDSISKVRKEIYTMGHRNPYHPRIDAKSGWIFTGEVGPDAATPSTTRGPEGREEWNLATAPGFFGHPYCVGNNTPWNSLTPPATNPNGYGAVYNCAAVQNVSPNNYGIRDLPPAKPALIWYSNNNTTDDGSRLGFTSGETAVGGPMYRYDPNLVSTVKFPPQYEGKVFFFDWAVTNKSSFRVFTLNPDGTIPTGNAATVAAPFAALTNLPPGNYIDARFGPDGALYLLKNSNGNYANFTQATVWRIEYKGTVNSACYSPFNVTVGPGSTALQPKAGFQKSIAPLFANGFVKIPAGFRTIELYDISGRQVWNFHREDAGTAGDVKLPANLSQGLLQPKLIP